MTRIGGKKARRPGPGAGGCGAERLFWAAGRRGARGGRHRKPAELGRALARLHHIRGMGLSGGTRAALSF